MFFNDESTSKLALAFKKVDFEVMVNYKVVDLQV